MAVKRTPRYPVLMKGLIIFWNSWALNWLHLTFKLVSPDLPTRGWWGGSRSDQGWWPISLREHQTQVKNTTADWQKQGNNTVRGFFKTSEFEACQKDKCKYFCWHLKSKVGINFSGKLLKWWGQRGSTATKSRSKFDNKSCSNWWHFTSPWRYQAKEFQNDSKTGMSSISLFIASIRLFIFKGWEKLVWERW